MKGSTPELCKERKNNVLEGLFPPRSRKHTRTHAHGSYSKYSYSCAIWGNMSSSSWLSKRNSCEMSSDQSRIVPGHLLLEAPTRLQSALIISSTSTWDLCVFYF